ncbi:hypothetical protein EVAR_21173_1 [Eumeta japonica]|uniref:Uncharacterized protein n=1 Tax=Eumeta variegata TaxID=151549 RepID=A0A4C1UNM3_EUMVA|nr:hypothetical protein EVAR_21173_1 [Eumeta japonica]
MRCSARASLPRSRPAPFVEAKLNASALARGVLLQSDVQNEVLRIKRERRRPGDQHVGLKSEVKAERRRRGRSSYGAWGEDSGHSARQLTRRVHTPAARPQPVTARAP